MKKDKNYNNGKLRIKCGILRDKINLKLLKWLTFSRGLLKTFNKG